MLLRVCLLLEVVIILPPCFLFSFDAYKLEEAYRLLNKDSLNVNYQRAFFEAFPNNFDTFNYYFGYYYEHYKYGVDIGHLLCPPRPASEPHKGRFYNYPTGYNYVTAFFESLPFINTDSFCDKTIRICFDGYYDADNISFFQGGVMYLALTKQYFYAKKSSHSPFWKCLDAYSDHEVTSFWFFYLGYNERIDNDLYVKTKEKLRKYPRLRRLLTQEYERILILEPRWEGH